MSAQNDFTFPDLDQSWEIVKMILDRATGVNTTEGVASLRHKFERTKLAALGRFFDETGRITLKTKRLAPDITWDYAYYQIHSRLLEFADKVAQKDRFAHVREVGPHYVVSWVLNRCMHYPVLDAARNQTEGGKGKAISTIITELLNGAGRDWNNGLLVKGDYNHYLRPYSADEKNQVKEIAQIIYSRVVELLRPMVDQTLTLVLSINPLDILAMSLHTTNWTSCQNILDGGHRAGALAYVTDTVTAIAYAYRSVREMDFLPADQNEKRPIYPVKLWRALVYIDVQNKHIMIGRQYPSTNDEIARAVRQMLHKILGEIHGEEIKQFTVIKRDRGNALNENEVTQTLTNSNMFRIESAGWSYPDAPTEHLFATGVDAPNVITVADAHMPCAQCGEPRVDWRNTSYLVCPDCGTMEDEEFEEGHFCHHCGDFVPDDEVYWYNGEPHCEGCVDEYHPVCDDCGERVDSPEEIYEYHDLRLCEACYDDRVREGAIA